MDRHTLNSVLDADPPVDNTLNPSMCIVDNIDSPPTYNTNL